jgi:photosystem II stability/assembly factor-like uncharacterized protein
MKKHLLLCLGLIFLFVNSMLFSQINQDWKWVHPTPHGNTLRYVKALNATTWLAVGYAGTFMKTTNAGTNWTLYTNAGGTQTSGQGKILYSGWFFDANTGLVCGSSGWIGRTTNGGLTWDSIACSSTGSLYGMHFVNSTTGFIGGSSATILKTTDAGLTWTALTGPTGTIYNIFALDVNNVYAPTSSSGVMFYTTNGGTNWTSTSTGGTTLYDANFINPNTGFVCGSSGHIKVTTNGCTSWTSVNVPSITSSYYELYATSQTTTPLIENFDAATFPPAGWRAVSVVGPVVWVRSTSQFHSTPACAFINYDCSPSGLDWLIAPQKNIASGDSLSFWLRKNDSGYPDSLQIMISTTDTALTSFTQSVLTLTDVTYPAAGTWGRFAVSLNAFAGQNIYVAFRHWDACGDGVFLDDVQIGTAGTQAVIYAVGDAMNIYKSATLGSSWTAVSHLDPTQPWTSTWYSMDISGTTMLAVGASGLFNVSTNSGANWVTKERWISAGTMYGVWCEYGTGKVWAVGSPGISGSTFDQILYSSNGGVNFVNQVPTGSWAAYRSIHMFNGTTGFISGQYGAIRKTTNGGTTWDSVATTIPSAAYLYKIDFIDANTGWVFSQTTTSGSVWKTTNGGTVWNAQSFGTIDGRIYSGDMVDANTGYVGNYTPKVLKTTDGGATWTELTNTPMGSGFIYGMKFLTANLGYVVGTAGARVCRTTNGGTSWDTVAMPYATSYYATDWVDANNGVVVGSTGVTCKTTNGGTSWILQNTSASTLYAVDMKTADTMYTVGSPAGAVLKWQKNAVGITTWTQTIPTSYYLSQNYPNPFNPVTTFKFGLPVKGAVTLNIYDITGRLVKTLFNNAPLNAGTVSVEFDGTNLASGVYFYTLLVDNNRIDTKKMILVK